jgi:hypothetical protein
MSQEEINYKTLELAVKIIEKIYIIDVEGGRRALKLIPADIEIVYEQLKDIVDDEKYNQEFNTIFKKLDLSDLK